MYSDFFLWQNWYKMTLYDYNNLSYNIMASLIFCKKILIYENIVQGMTQIFDVNANWTYQYICWVVDGCIYLGRKSEKDCLVS